MWLKSTLETIMTKSSVDHRRVDRMYNLGASDDEVGYHTAYAWADAVNDLLTMLEEQRNSLAKTHGMLYGLDDACDVVQAAMDHITREMEIEEQILGEFWSHKPEDFDRFK